MVHGTRLTVALSVAVLLHFVATSQGTNVSVRVTAYARAPGEVGAWQLCLLRSGISARFGANPSLSTNDALGVPAQRTVLTVHVAPSVRSGAYPLILLSFSYLDGPKAYPLIRGFTPTLKVLPNHRVFLPAFNTWHWIPSPDPQDLVPAGRCTPLPPVSAPLRRVASENNARSL